MASPTITFRMQSAPRFSLTVQGTVQELTVRSTAQGRGGAPNQRQPLTLLATPT